MPLRHTIAGPESRQLIEPCRKRRRTGVEASHQGRRLTTAWPARVQRDGARRAEGSSRRASPRSSLHAAAASGVRNSGEVVAAPGARDQRRAEGSREQGDEQDEGTAHVMVQRAKRQNGSVRVSAKADYAIRAGVELAAAGEGPLKGERIAQAQQIPANFLENILSDLRNAGLVSSRRGADGGYWLARPAAEISLADIIRAVDGPLANVRGVRSEQVEYAGNAERLRDVWVAVRASLRAVLERVTLADLAAGELPESVQALAVRPGRLGAALERPNANVVSRVGST